MHAASRHRETAAIDAMKSSLNATQRHENLQYLSYARYVALIMNQ